MRLATTGLAIAATLATACGGGDDVGGQLHLTWSVTLDGVPVASCAEVGAVQVEVRATLEGATEAESHRWPCDDLEGTTGNLAEGSHTVVVSLLDDSATPIVSALAQSGVVVTLDEVTELGAYTFPFSDEVDLETVSIYVDHGEPGGDNCVAVTEQRLYVYDLGGDTCLDLDLQVGGVTTADTCGDGQPCVALDVEQQVELEAGSYEVVVEGYAGATLCYATEVPEELVVVTDTRLDLLVPSTGNCGG